MREITLMNSLQNQKQSNDSESRELSNHPASILLGLLGGLLCALIGFLLFTVYAATGEAETLENYAGVGFLVAAFIFFGVSAHCMDEADKMKRRSKKNGIRKFKQENYIK